MKRIFVIISAFTLCLTYAIAQESGSTAYSSGVFVVNEDWHGHNNGTINFLDAGGQWNYRVFQKENPGHELGCTTQYGTIYGGRMYIVSKQDKDSGSSAEGSRLAICDASTMKLIKEIAIIASGSNGKSIADGRSYLPVNNSKGYIGTSNGIWIFDAESMKIGSCIKGTENPNTDPYGSHYLGQTGTMLRANDLVFAVHQQYGILVIDAESDTIRNIIKAPAETDGGKEVQHGFGTIVMSKDGMLWASITRDVNGTGDAMPYMYRIDPMTLECSRIDIPVGNGIEMIPNSWYAWNAGSLCASKQNNRLYWKGLNADGTWFSSTTICGYDIDSGEFFSVTDLAEEQGGWSIYGTGLRISPVTDEIYALLYKSNESTEYKLAVISSDGTIKKEYPMEDNYWFPAMPVFTDDAAPVVSDEFPSEITLWSDVCEQKIYLGSMASDADNMDAAITKRVVSVIPAESGICASVRNDSLVISCSEAAAGCEAAVKIEFNSNGKTVERTLSVKCSTESGIRDAEFSGLCVRPCPAASEIRISTEDDADVRIFTLSGDMVKRFSVCGDAVISLRGMDRGIYLVSIEAGGRKETVKLINN